MPWVSQLILTLMPAILLAYFYCGLRFYNALIDIVPWPKTYLKGSIIGLVVFLNLHPLFLIIFHIFGLKNLARAIREGSRVWDFFFSYPFWVGVLVIAELLPWLIFIDFVKLPFYPFYVKLKTDWLLIQSQVTLVLFALIFLYVFIRIIVDSNRIKITKITLADSKLSAAVDGLEIVHISDVQADSRTRHAKLSRYVNKVNKLKPDVVFFTGDLVTTGTKFIERAAAILGGLKADYGVYACFGDHDYWANPAAIKKSLRENGIVLLEDANEFINVGSFDTLMVTFITNTYSKRPNLDKMHSLMGYQPRGALDILVTHQPSENIIELAAERGYHLFLAGHSHGGQVILKPFGFTLTAPRFESPFFKGIRYVENMMVSINSGLGFTVAPIRYRAPAEITLVKVVRLP